MAGPAVPARPDPGPLMQRKALGVGLPAPAAGQVKNFRGGPAHRQHRRQFLDEVGVRPVVRQGVAELEQAAVVDPDLGPDRDTGVGVGLGDDGGTSIARIRCGGSQPEPGGERHAVSVAAESGTAAPAGGSLWDQPKGHRGVQRGVRHGVTQQRKVRQVRAEVGAEMQQGRLAGAEIDEQRGARASQVQRCRGQGGSCGIGFRGKVRVRVVHCSSRRCGVG